MANKIRSIKTPNFLAKNLFLIIITGVAVLFFIFNIKPSNFFIVVIFLLLLFVFLSNLFSFLLFLIWYKGEMRVWYLKHDAFLSIHKKNTYLSLTIVLMLLLKHLEQLNPITLTTLCVLIPVFYYFFEKRA